MTEFVADNKAMELLATIKERGKQSPEQLSHVLNLPIGSVDKYIHEAQYLKLVIRTRKAKTARHRDDYHMEHFHTHIVLTDEGDNICKESVHKMMGERVISEPEIMVDTTPIEVQTYRNTSVGSV